MKKKISMILMMVVVLSLSTLTVFADDNSDENLIKVLELVEETNEKIDELITKAVDKADDEMDEYLEELDELALDKVMLESELNYYQEKLKSYDVNSNDNKKVKKEIRTIKKIINALNEEINEIDEEMNALNNEMNMEIQKIIDKLIDETNQCSADTRAEAAELGYTVICEWVEVEIADRMILVDPLRVLGR